MRELPIQSPEEFEADVKAAFHAQAAGELGPNTNGEFACHLCEIAPPRVLAKMCDDARDYDEHDGTFTSGSLAWLLNMAADMGTHRRRFEDGMQ